MSDEDRNVASPEETGIAEDTSGAGTPVAEESLPRRSKAPAAPEVPSGYRSSRRASKAAKSAKRALAVFRVREAATRTADGVHRGAWVGVRVLGMTLLGGATLLAVLFVLALGVNAGARWLALARAGDANEIRDAKAKENLLVIGVEGGTARGLLALRVAGKEKRVFGLAIPEGAFVEVPGQGFEKVGDSYRAGAKVSMAAISNYLSVPFERHVVVDASVYEQVMQKQSVAGLLDAATSSDLTAEETERLRKTMDNTPSDDVLIVALPVKPISLGDETYFEPRRAEVADLIESWWDVKVSGGDEPSRLIVYNGSGVPGIAGTAAQQLIRGGFRVVDTKNADNFGYAHTLIIVQRPGEVDPAAVRDALGVGRVLTQPSDQRIADVIVIIGKDYAPPKDG